MAQQPNDYALVLGINDYPGYRSLKGAIRDAEKFAEWLVDTTAGGGLPAANVELILSKASPTTPLTDDVDAALDALLQRVGSNGPARRVYLFFSGHGLVQVEAARTATAFCLGKWTERWRNYAMDADCYVNYLVQSQKAAEIVLFADCCRIRKVSSQGRCPAMGAIAPAAAPSQVRQFRAYATEQMDAAFEAAENADAAEIRGHFSRALLNGLWGGAAEPGGGVKALRLKAYLEEHVPRIAMRSSHKQKPVVEPLFASHEEPVFGDARPDPPQVNVRITFADRTPGPVELEGPDINTFHRADASVGQWDLSLRAGTYILRRNGVDRQRITVESLREVLDVAD